MTSLHYADVDRFEEMDVLIDTIRSNRDSAELLKAVAQNPSEQTFDLQMSCASVGAALAKQDASVTAACAVPMSALLRKLVDTHAVMMENNGGVPPAAPGTMFAHWLYENSTRLKKICIVRKIMSYRTLASFVGAGTPPRQKPLSIPTYILEAWHLLCLFEKLVMEEHARRYIDDIVLKVDPDFLALTDSEEARRQALDDTEEFIIEQGRQKRARAGLADDDNNDQ